MSYMGGVDGAVSAAHQFSLLQYDEDRSACRPIDSIKESGIVKGGVKREELSDAELLSQMTPKPKFTEVPPAGVVSPH